MRESTNYNWRALTLLLMAVWVARTTMAQDYPKYAPAGSTFVPLDSWVYGALDRLTALGWVTTSLEGMKPWTRTECARLTQEAAEAMHESSLQGGDASEVAVRLQKMLEREFAMEMETISGGSNRSFRLESVYARALSISGAPLTDGYHFGQTVAYDFGRPFERGFNAITGGAVRATYGPFAFYVRAEYQHAPSAPALSLPVRELIAQMDATPLTVVPVQPAVPISAINRVHLLDAYVSFNLDNWQVSFGKQSLSWSVGGDRGMLFSENADPFPMLRLTRVLPARLPGIFSYAGPFRVEAFIGRLEGGFLNTHRWLYGHKFSFKVGPHVELGYGRTAILGGSSSTGAEPFTFPNFVLSFFGLHGGNGVIPGSEQDSFDVVVRLPKLHDGAELYADLFAHDLAIYWMLPPRGSYRVGFHVDQLPVLHRLDFRVEADSTVSGPGFGQTTTGPINYTDLEYRDGYTNSGFLMGNTIGREGLTYQFWSGYHFSERNALELSFKHSLVDPAVIPGGASWVDYDLRHTISFDSGIYVKSRLQFEHIYRYPVLFPGTANNVTAAIEIGFSPVKK
jgi:hypothetical protein